ncbi:MAG: 3'-5' exonuclease [Thiomicrospira sp.]|jgi:hypothetical protein|nr:3'-5' exonuclease [Thiomicrospira sp.]
MAEIIPALNRETLSKMTAGEKRLANRLEAFLEDDYLVWYDIPIGKNRRYPDFIILHPSRGLLFLEVKDWRLDNIKSLTKTQVSLLTNKGLVTRPHPLEQARQYTYAVIEKLQRDPALIQTFGDHQGNLVMPYGWGVVFTNITEKQMQQAMPIEADRNEVLPAHLMLYKNEMTENSDAEAFQEKLWGMFKFRFGTKLTLPQIDRIRWHLFPEIRITHQQQDLFNDDATEDEPSKPIEQTLPDIIKIMDLQQEKLARSLGEGHRVIHGVAGSGKTMILGYRCLYLAQRLQKPILVLCFNITLAAKLRSFISEKGIHSQVQVYHFHDWCSEQLRTYHVGVAEGEAPYYERAVEAVIKGVERDEIPRAQYGALLIDEGHDFEADWLRLVVQMIDPSSNALLLLYDDAQSIYSNRSGLGFSLSSVGIQAKGRTTVLRLNYRNTKQILEFAYRFAKHYINPQDSDDDHIPLIEPQASGNTGPEPFVKRLNSLDEEIDYAIGCIQKWQKAGVALKDIAVLYTTKYQGQKLDKALKNTAISYQWLADKKAKQAYNSEKQDVAVLTIHSSKGLEFQRVILIGAGYLNDADDQLHKNARVLYVGMTRAQEGLVLTTSKQNRYTEVIGV